MPSKLTMLRSWLTAKSLVRNSCLVLLTFFSLSAFAQTRITGTVTNPTTNLPVGGASVQVAGTSIGVVTADNGSFTINVPAGKTTLVVSFVGFKRKEVVIGNQTNLSITLEEDASGLSEVVVTGYSSQQRRNIVGAVSTVKGEQLAAVPSGNPEQQLQ